MASPSAVTAETLITLKINHDGTNKRFKLPLRDLGAATLETKLRALLIIAPATETRFERYSDSAGSYIMLNPSDVSVYKQLYRAAKAKQKLKFRVTSGETATHVTKGPKPASVEDVADSEAEVKSVPLAVKNDAPLISLWTSADAQQQTLVTPPAPALELPSQLLAEVQQSQPRVEHTVSQIEGSVAAMTLQELSQAMGVPAMPPPTGREVHAFAVYCNSCDKTIADAHFHCSTCDDGDFDLCQACVDQNITCHGEGHWLIKRTMKDSMLINSTTERIAPKPKPMREAPFVVASAARSQEPLNPTSPFGSGRLQTAFLHGEYTAPGEMVEVAYRTCNSCVQDYPEHVFVHCACCEDFDLCTSCFVRNEHGHDPKHGFVPATEPNHLEPAVLRLLAPGRAQLHSAICNHCSVAITGIRHKCLDCPDFDFCSRCMQQSKDSHPGHRFVPLYEPTETGADLMKRQNGRPIHHGICCDGPLCQNKERSAFIQGIRYKCAVCHDTDFCANCEATPVNAHNRTHPLIKFKTPVRFVSVSTSGECHGKALPVAGDRPSPRLYRPRFTSSRSTETACPGSAASNVQTVVNVQPSASVKVASVKVEDVGKPKLEQIAAKPPVVVAAAQIKDLVAVYKSDTVVDGTMLPPNHVFEQTWILKNQGKTAWPAGCSVKFVGGDYMGHVDPSHPAAVSDLESSSESTVCYAALAPGQEFPFTVLLRTPSRTGRVVSNWRLTTKDGLRFGHRLWCDVVVSQPQPEKHAVELGAEKPQEMATTSQQSASQVIFPKLEKESPVVSTHVAADPVVHATSTAAEDDFEKCGEDDEWNEDEDCFLTDEEYDVLDASDEEYLEDQQIKAHHI